MKITKKLLVAILTVAILVSAFAIFASADEPVVVNDDILEYYEQNFDISYDISGVADGGAYPEDFVYKRNGGKYLQKVYVEDADGEKYIVISAGEKTDDVDPGNIFLKWDAGKDLNGVFLDFDIKPVCVADLPKICCTQNKKGSNKCEYGKNGSTLKEGDAIPSVGDPCPGTLGSGAQCPGTVTSVVVNNSYDSVAHVMLSDIVEGIKTDDKDPVLKAHTQGIDLLIFDMKTKTLKYTEFVSGASTVKTVENFTLSPTEWYDVNVAYNAETMSYKFTVTAQSSPETTVTVSDIPAPYSSVRTVKIGLLGSGSANGGENDSRGSQVHLDNLTSQGGTFKRNDADKQTESDAWVVKYSNLISQQTTTDTAKRKIIEIFGSMTGYAAFSNEAKAGVKQIANAALDELEGYLQRINREDSYIARIAALSSYATFYNTIPESLEGYDNAAEFTVAKTKYEAEALELLTIKSESDAVVAALADIDFNNTAYGYLNAKYEAIKNLKYDATVPSATTVNESRTKLIESVAAIKATAEQFIARVNAAKIEGSTAAFLDRYKSYLDAKGSPFTDTTYPGIQDTLTLFGNLMTQYTAVENTCASFIFHVNSAKINLTFNGKATSLAAAASEMAKAAFEPTFAGVAEAKVTYDAINADIADKKAKADAYIAAANALVDITNETELIAAIAAAEALQTAGNVEGYAGVSDANAKLSNAKSRIELKVGYSDKFVKIVTRLDTATGINDKFDIIKEALAIDDNYLDSTNADVTAKSAKLGEAIAAYNTLVAAINAENSGEVASAPAPIASVDFVLPENAAEKVIAIIKEQATV